MDEDNKGLGIGSAGRELKKAFKEGTLFTGSDSVVGGTGYAPNADNLKRVDDTDELEQIAEGADPEAVRKAAEEIQKANAYNPLDYENRRSQSVVYSQREITEQQLAEVRARNEAAMREQQRIQTEEKVKRTGFKLGVGVFIAILVTVVVVLVVVVITSIRRPVAPPEPEPDTPDMPLSTVDGYSCETKLCGKVTDLPDGRILLRDTAYYLYDTNAKERTSTTIDAKDYIDVKAFVWGEKDYLTLDPSSDLTALYSISENRYVIGYTYDQYFTSIDDPIYDEMHDYEGEYIIAKVNGAYKMIDLVSGLAVVSGNVKVFAHDNFFFGYEDGGRVYAYTKTGKVIKTVTPDENNKIYTRDGKLVLLVDSAIDIYDAAGESLYDDPILDEFWQLNYDEYADHLASDARFYAIPID